MPNHPNVTTFLENAGGLYGWDEAKVARLKQFLIKVGAYPEATWDKLSQACTNFEASENERPPKEQTPDPN